MGRPGVFFGSIWPDLIAWGVGGQLFGGAVGFASAEAVNWIANPPERHDAVWIGGRAAFSAAILALLFVGVGHAVGAIFF